MPSASSPAPTASAASAVAAAGELIVLQPGEQRRYRTKISVEAV